MGARAFSPTPLPPTAGDALKARLGAASPLVLSTMNLGSAANLPSADPWGAQMMPQPQM